LTGAGGWCIDALHPREERETDQTHGQHAISQKARAPDRPAHRGQHEAPLAHPHLRPQGRGGDQRRSRIRTFIRRVEEAIASGDREAAQSALRAAQPEIMRGATKGVIHRNKASRRISRLHNRINAMQG